MNRIRRLDLAVWLAMFLAFGCGEEKHPAEARKVRLAEAVAATIEDAASFNAVLAAKETVEVRAQVRGYLTERLFEEGARIEEGATLYRLDDRELKAAYEAAKANAAKAETIWKNDEVNRERFTTLAERGAVSLLERDDAATKAAGSKAAYEAARADEDRAAANLDHAVITAPVPGFITRSLVDVGALVEAGGTLLTTIYNLDPIRAEFSVTDREFINFRRVIQERGGDPKAVRFQLYLGDERHVYPHEGILEMADPVVDSRTNTMGVRAEFPNPENTLRPGLYVNVTGFLGKREVVTVPDEAVVDTGNGGKAVFIVDENSALAIRPVETGRLEGGRRVITEGLSAGQKVVTEGLVTAQPGMPVEVVESAPAAPAAP